MSGERETRRVFRVFWAWNDEKEERWLEAQAREGWHLRGASPFRYTFERGQGAEMAYRSDFQGPSSAEREEYLAIFRDAGWEHAATSGCWHYFRKAVVDGKVPEIYTDTQSRIAKYQRLVALLVVMLAVLVVVGPRGPAFEAHSSYAWAQTIYDWAGKIYPYAFFVMLLAMTIIAYSLVRLTLLINRLKKRAAQQG